MGRDSVPPRTSKTRPLGNGGVGIEPDSLAFIPGTCRAGWNVAGGPGEEVIVASPQNERGSACVGERGRDRERESCLVSA